MSLVSAEQCIIFSQINAQMIDLPDTVTFEDYVGEVLGRQDLRIKGRVGASIYDSADETVQADLQQALLLYVRADLRRSYATKCVSYQYEPLPSEFRVDPGEMRKLAQQDEDSAEEIIKTIPNVPAEYDTSVHATEYGDETDNRNPAHWF